MRALRAGVFVIGLALAGSAEARTGKGVDREFRKVERRLYGTDAGIRTACEAAGGVLIEDRRLEVERSIELRRSDVTVRGRVPADLRACVAAIARAGVIDGWTLRREEDGGHSLRILLVRGRRDPGVSGRRAREESDREAAKALGELSGDRRPEAEALAPELLAPDLVVLHEARWNAGNLFIDASAEAANGIDGYRRLIEPLLAEDSRVEWNLRVLGEKDAAAMPEIAESGLLRAAVRDAPVSSLLRLFAALDRREFVMASSGERRTGSVGGGWDGLVEKVASDLGRSRLRVGAVDVLAPPGTRAPRPDVWGGKKVTMDLEEVDGDDVLTLLAAAGEVKITSPRLGPTDVRVKATPWDQVMRAVALAHGCQIEVRPASPRAGYEVACPESVAGLAVVEPDEADAEAKAREPDHSSETNPLERASASTLKVVAIGTRDSARWWRAVVETPEGLHVLIRTGTLLGLEPGQAVVDENGVSIVLERIDVEGKRRLGATRLIF